MTTSIKVAVVVWLASLVAFVVLILSATSGISGTPGVQALSHDLGIPPHGRLCTSNVVVPRKTKYVTVLVGTFFRPGPPIAASLMERGTTVSRGPSRSGYRDNSKVALAFDRSPGRDVIGTVCIANLGRIPISLYGSAGVASPGTTSIDGRPQEADPLMVFLYDKPIGAGELIPAMVRRAALLKASWTGTWTFWVLLPALVLIPLLAALGAASGGSDPKPRCGIESPKDGASA